MNLIEPKVEIWQQKKGIKGMYEHIERCARVCYRSENKGNITAEQFVKGLIKRKHYRPLEFGTLVYPKDSFYGKILSSETRELWCKERMINEDEIIITNLRHIVKLYPDNWEHIVNQAFVNMQDKICDVNIIRPTFHWNISRGIADEFRTHISISSLMESTRYVNYHRVGKDGMKNLNDKNNHMDFVKPYWYNPNFGDIGFESTLAYIEDSYSKMIENGLQPQQAREILPLCIATNLVQCSFDEAWQNFFNQRCNIDAHPDAQYIAKQAKVIFDALNFNSIQNN